MGNHNADKQAHKRAERLAKLSPEQREVLRRQMAAKRLRGSDLAARSLRECGITHVYAVSGNPTEHILSACSANSLS